MDNKLLTPQEVFNKIDSIDIPEPDLIEWCKLAGRDNVETLKILLSEKHHVLAMNARTISSQGASEDDIEAVLYELMYFAHNYRTADKVAQTYYPTN